MRGDDRQPDAMFSYVSAEQRVPADHPLRAIPALVDGVLRDMSREFDGLYARVGRPSIPPERLLRAQLLQIFYSIRSERLLMEQLDYNLLFRWSGGMDMDEPIWAVPADVGDEYADGDRRTPVGEQSAHRPTDNLNRRRIGSPAAEGPFFHAAKREQDARLTLRECRSKRETGRMPSRPYRDRTARPTALRFGTRISSYSRETTMPLAPASRDLTTA